MREAWDVLADCALEPNPYFESWHLLPALRAHDPGETVQLLMFESGGQLAGMIPLVSEMRLDGKRRPHLAMWTHPDCGHAAPLVAAGCERAFWKALFAWADGRGRHGSFLRLPDLPLDGPLHRALESVLADERRNVRVSGHKERSMLAGGVTPEEHFAAVLTEAERADMERNLHALDQFGDVTFERTGKDAGLSAWIDRFVELDEVGRSGNVVSTAGTLLRHQLEGAARRGRLERLAVSLDGKPIAMMANFLVPPGAFVHRTVRDGVFAEFSPEILLHCDNLLMLDRKDIAWTDCCAAESQPAIERLWCDRRATGTVSLAIGGNLRRALFARRLG